MEKFVKMLAFSLLLQLPGGGGCTGLLLPEYVLKRQKASWRM